MTFLSDLHNPPPVKGSLEEHYQFFNSTNDMQQATFYISNPTVLTNGNFSAGGATITQADGDGATFFTDWKVQGASVATYTLTPTNYPANSTIQSASATFSRVQISAYTSGDFYFYQRQSTVRKYQQSPLTYGIQIKNNLSSTVKIRMDIYSFYDGSTPVLKMGKPIYLKQGITKITSTILTDSLRDLTVGAAPYTEFRLTILDLGASTADFEMYYIKCEFGTISTILEG